MTRASLLLLLLLLATVPALAAEVTLERPPAGKETILPSAAGDRYLLTFSPGEADAFSEGDDLLLEFGDGAIIRLTGLVALVLAGAEPPVFVADGIEFDAAQVILSLEALDESEAVAEAAGPDPGVGAVIGNGSMVAAPEPSPASPPEAGGRGPASVGTPEGVQVAATGRSLLFPCEEEAEDYALYSYLLFRSARPNDPRRLAAARAFIQETDSLEALEAAGLAREDTNAFLAPVNPEGVTRNCRDHPLSETDRAAYRDLRRALERDRERQLEVLDQDYHFARARILLGRLGLQDDGPYIVAAVRPLLDAADVTRDEVLVLNLSREPARLAGLWVGHFKDQFAREPGVGRDVAAFAVSARSLLGRVADALSVTREAAAQVTELLPGGS